MAEHDSITSRLQRLALYRHTLEFLAAQRGQASALAPDALSRQVDDTRREIVLIKRELRAMGMLVEDHPADDDMPGAAAQFALAGDQAQAILDQYHRMLAEQMRDLVFDGMSGAAMPRRPLVELYIERTCIPADQVAPGEAAPTLADLLRPSGSHVILVGEVGSGRSICMQRIALACAARAIGEVGPASDLVAGWPDPPKITLFLHAYEIEVLLHQLSVVQKDAHESPVSLVRLAIDTWLHERQLDALAPIIWHELERGGCLLLLDGIEEVLAQDALQRVAMALHELGAFYPNNRVVAATTQLERTQKWLHEWNSYRLAPLDRSQLDAMVDIWLHSLASRSMARAHHDIADQVVVLQGLLHGDALTDELAARPLVLVLWILAYAAGHPLPAARGIILWWETNLLLNGWGQSRQLWQVLGLDSDLAGEPLLSLLQPLALKLQDSGREVPALTFAEIQHLLKEPLADLGVAPDQAVALLIPHLLRWCCGRALLAEVAPARYTTPRRVLYDYLATRARASWPDFPQRAAVHAAESGWRQSLALVTYDLARSTRPETARELARLLMRASALPTSPERQSLLVAAECLTALDCAGGSIEAFRADAQLRLVALLGARDAELRERVQAGTLLGRLGDPRFGNVLPPLASVAAGPFIFGMPGGFDDEGPARRVDVPAFTIGIYPVTNQEYSAFLKDSAHRLPHYWHDSRFNNPSCPVVGVTWHDAMAYCGWLQARLAAAGLLAHDTIVRLPLELEWEKAASWDPRSRTKRRYPWGETWSNSRANTVGDRGPWMITPVGCYPEGMSAYGLHDCIGNVWEWTASEYRSYPGAAVPFYEPGSYALRGSSCVALPKQARCTYRSRLPADYWRYHLGFRIVIARPPNGLGLL